MYQDNDKSASKFAKKPRPDYERMIADIEAGKIQAVVVYKADRLHRRPKEGEEFIDLAERRGVELATVTGRFDLSTAEGRMMYRFFCMNSAYESEVKSERQLRAAQQKAQRGLPQWRNAFGYKRDGDVIGLDPETAPLVREAYAAIINGCALSDICRLFNDAGKTGLNGSAWTPTTVSLFLRAARNAGIRSHNDEIVRDKQGDPVKGVWPAIVDYETWQSAQHILSDISRKPGRKSVTRHLLTGVLTCGKCGHHLSGGSRQKDQRVYSCIKCRGVSIRAAHVEPLLYEIVAGRLAKGDAVDLLKSQIHDAAEADRVRGQLANFYAERQNIGLERAKGLLTGEQAQIATQYLNDQIAELERQQQDDERLRVFEDIPLGRPEVHDKIQQLPAGRYRAVLDVLMTITIKPVGKGQYQVVDARTGRKGIIEDRVQIQWK